MEMQSPQASSHLSLHSLYSESPLPSPSTSSCLVTRLNASQAWFAGECPKRAIFHRRRLRDGGRVYYSPITIFHAVGMLLGTIRLLKTIIHSPRATKKDNPLFLNSGQELCCAEFKRSYYVYSPSTRDALTLPSCQSTISSVEGHITFMF